MVVWCSLWVFSANCILTFLCCGSYTKRAQRLCGFPVGCSSSNSQWATNSRSFVTFVPAPSLFGLWKGRVQCARGCSIVLHANGSFHDRLVIRYIYYGLQRSQKSHNYSCNTAWSLEIGKTYLFTRRCTRSLLRMRARLRAYGSGLVCAW